MKSHEFGSVRCDAGHRWRDAVAGLGARLMRAWVALYALPPRRPTPLV